MPDANGQMFLSDFRAELQARGFDGYTAAELNTLVNRGYFYIARKYPWLWRQTTATFTYPTSGFVAASDLSNSLPRFKNVRAVYLKGYSASTSAVRLTAIDEVDVWDTYYQAYLQGETGVPNAYFIDQDQLYALPKLSPVGSVTLEVHYNNRPAALTADSSICITPVDLDEAILLASLVRCHKRALETQLALMIQVELDEFLDDLRDLEGDRMDDLQERVRPDNQWA